MVGPGQVVLPELPDDIDRDMVAAGDMDIEKQPMQVGLIRQFDPSLLHQFAPQCFAEALANLDPAAWQMPAGDIAVLDQEHLVVAVEPDAADPQGHAAGDPRTEMRCRSDLPLKPLSNILQPRHGYPG